MMRYITFQETEFSFSRAHTWETDFSFHRGHTRETEFRFYWVGKKFFALFSKISWNGREHSRILHVRSIYRWYEYCSNDNKIIEMEIDLELEMKLSRRELRLLLLHEFRLDRKATEATSNICGTMGKAVLSILTAQH